MAEELLLIGLMSSSDSEDEMKVMRLRKQLRDRSDPLSLTDKAFKQRFRVTKDAFNYILKELQFTGHMSTSVPPHLQLAATLSLLAMICLCTLLMLFIFVL